MPAPISSGPSSRHMSPSVSFSQANNQSINQLINLSTNQPTSVSEALGMLGFPSILLSSDQSIKDLWYGSIDQSIVNQKIIARIDKKLIFWKPSNIQTISQSNSHSNNQIVWDEIDTQILLLSLNPKFQSIHEPLIQQFTPSNSQSINQNIHSMSDAIRTVLRMDAAFNHRHHCVQGYAALAFHLLKRFNNQSILNLVNQSASQSNSSTPITSPAQSRNATMKQPINQSVQSTNQPLLIGLVFSVIQCLTSSVKRFRSDTALNQSLNQSTNQSTIRNDVLIVSCVLSMNQPKLTDRLNDCSFDCFDLSEIAVSYFFNFFASSGVDSLIDRLIDCSILDSPTCLSYIWFGLLTVRQADINQSINQSSTQSLYQTINDLPLTLTKDQVNQAFEVTYQCFNQTNNQINQSMTPSKVWQALVNQSETIKFQPYDTLEQSLNQSINQTNNPIVRPTRSSISQASTQIIDVNQSNNQTVNQSNNQSNNQATAAKPDSAGQSLDHSMNLSNNQSTNTSVTFNLDELSIDSPRTVQNMNTSNNQPNKLIDRLADLEADPTASINQLKDILGAVRKQLITQTINQSNNQVINQSISQAIYPANRANNQSNNQSTNQSNNQSINADLKSLLLSNQSAKQPINQTTIKWSDLALYQSMPCLTMNGYLFKSRQANKFLSKHTINQSNNSSGKSSNNQTINPLSSLFGAVLNRRWFVLNGAFLTYFKSHTQQKPSHDESLDVRQCQIEEITEPQFMQFGFGFEIKVNQTINQTIKQPNKKTKQSNNQVAEPLFVLFAATEEERSTWMRVLKLMTGQE